MESTHSKENLQIIDSLLKAENVLDYRFCVENDCYVCDRHGIFYSVCKRQFSKSGRLVEDYRVVPLKGSVDKYGYTTYRITVDGIKKHLKGHRLMMNAWIGCCNDLVVNHKDGNKTNNALDNLEWCTVAENNAHAIATGLFDPYFRKGVLRAVNPSEWMSIYIMNKHCAFSLSELARMNGCSHDSIKNIVNKIDSLMGEEHRYAG